MKASSSSSSATSKWAHDVFLSFGVDTSHNFTDHLHNNLVQRGIKTFRDYELPRGEEISQALVQAIQGSKLSLIVFSENYASSEWCMDELVHILESNRSNQQQNVRSVFYKVDPSDLKHQRSSFGDALAKHERKFKDNMDKVLRWRTALTEAANLSLWHFSDHRYESKFINEIVEKISTQLKEHSYPIVAKYSVGVESRVQEILERLDVGESDIRMVGIWGTGGIGKTTIAKAVYKSIAHKFEGSCFLENVGEESKVHGGLLNLQKILLCKIVESEELKLINVDEGTTLLRERLRHKKILLVLDDVSESYQLEKLAGASNWFGRGSRIIITTRDKHLLFIHEINPIYKVRGLDPHEAGELFSLNAFKDKTDLDDNEKFLVSSAVEYAQGLPLALEVLGAHLRRTSMHKWQSILDSYKRSPLQDIQKILKISYEELEPNVKEVFLDIACFFKGQKKNDVIQILERSGRINLEHSIEVLEEKALINVECGYIWMHKFLEEMGKEIVRQESPNEPRERTILWHHKEILTKNTETNEPVPQDVKVKIHEPDESHEISFSKASSTERTFLCIALCLEIMSLCFDQLSTPRKPMYALFGMLLAIAAVLNCICELIHKGIKEGVVLRRRGILWWFHYPGSPDMPFGTLPDLYGLVGGLFQCICSAIQYVYFIRHDQNPIKVSLLPTVFVICLAVSRVNWNRRDENIEQND